MTFKTLLLGAGGLGAMAILAGCGGAEAPDAADTAPATLHADLVVVNARIHTMDGAPGFEAAGGATASVLCVSGDVVVYVGEDAAACAAGPEARRIDAGGRLVLPGLIDTHSHIFGGSISEQKVNLSLADTMEKLLAALEAIREDNPGDGVVFARGWQNHLFPPEGPRAALLDEVFGPRPVILTSVDGHSTWFSTRALELGGASAATPDPEPGVSFFERDPETGDLLGVAREGAGAFIVRKLVSLQPSDYEAALRRWLPRASEAGLTGVFDAGMGAPTEDEAYAILDRMAAEDELPLRVYFSTADRGGDDDPGARFPVLKDQYRQEFFTPAAVKLFADGVPEAHTAYLAHDYKDRPGFRGEPMTQPERLNRLVASAAAHGAPAHIHAIGGAAVTISLDAMEAAEDVAPAVRHAIAHMDLVEPTDVPRFADLGVVAQTSIQWATIDPSFANLSGFVGEEEMRAAYPVRTLMSAGAVQTFGADWPASA